MASGALDGTRLGTAEGLTRPGTWLMSPPSFLLVHFDHFIFLQGDRLITPRFARP
jgi:hypothetical protein